jgi:hypothetical protein
MKKIHFQLHGFTFLKRFRTPPWNASHLQGELVIARGEGLFKKVMKQYA